MKPCLTHVTHHAYPDEQGVAPCCGVHWQLLIDAREALTTDEARVTCGVEG